MTNLIQKSEQHILNQAKIFSEKKKFFLTTALVLSVFSVLGSIPLIILHALHLNATFLALSIALFVFGVILSVLLSHILVTVKGTYKVTVKSLDEIGQSNKDENLIKFLESINN